MKRVFAIAFAALLLCLALPIAASAAGKDITADFTDPAFRAAVQELIGKNVILDTDVAGIKELSLSRRKKLNLWGHEFSGSWNIKNLAGLEYFVGLESLDCGNNKLTSLPKLPDGLRYLYCHENKLTSLPNLPDSMEVIRCANNRLTALPMLPSGLRELSCEYNRLANGFDVTGLLAMEIIDCRFNGMLDQATITGFTGEWDTSVGSYKFNPQRNWFAIILSSLTMLFSLIIALF